MTTTVEMHSEGGATVSDQVEFQEQETPACVFCEIIAKRAPAADLQEHGSVVSFIPLNPVVAGHRLFVPTRHVADAFEVPKVTGHVMRVLAEVNEKAPRDANIITSAGPDATQTVFHLHLHYVPRRVNDGLVLPWTNQEPVRSADGPSSAETDGR